ncbi:nucleotidyltransferase family protein [Chondromyces crocatus]|uniref:nucleotidyltransferase family protein n=1 Tax=Chondromyces crocatus TaxID=52 RepID=UPI001C54D6CE|nr:nucleotidyltransferase family protein [Chondromyces crocatus]
MDTRLREAAGVVLQALAEARIAAAPIKGVVTSVALYDDPLERPFGDVDVLVGRHDLAGVRAVAREQGWRLVHDSRQLFAVNVVVPPGLPVDVRASLGPPALCRVSAEEILARAEEVRDPRVVRAPFRMLTGHDHLLVLLLDAVLDKLALGAALRRRELELALRRWVGSPEGFAEHLRAAGFAGIAWVVLRWLEGEGREPMVEAIRMALEPLPPVPRWLAAPTLEAFGRAPYGPMARVGVRMIADVPWRGVAALVLGAVGTVRYHVRHRGRDPWEGVLWKGE